MDVSDWKNQRCLVTGGAGFGGSHLCEHLIKRGAKVFVLDRWLPKNSYLILSETHTQVQFLQGDVKHIESLKLTLERFQIDTVFHLAAQPIIPISNIHPYETLNTNVLGTYAVLEAMRTSKCAKRLIFASSGAYYGTTTTREPIDEEEAPLSATNIYAPSKVAADIAVRCYAKVYGLKSAVCRFMNTYGPGDTNFSRIVPQAIRNLMQEAPYDFGVRDDGTTALDFLYIADMARAYIKTAECLDAIAGEAINFGGGKLKTTREMADRISFLFDERKRKPVFRGERKSESISKLLNIDKARRCLQWKPATSLDEGLEETIKWYRRFWKSL